MFNTAIVTLLVVWELSSARIGDGVGGLLETVTEKSSLSLAGGAWYDKNGTSAASYDYGDFSRCTYAAKLGGWKADGSSDLRRRRDECSRLRYRPHSGYEAPDLLPALARLPNGTAVYFFGDSLTLQFVVDFLCALSSVGELVGEDGVEVIRWPRGQLVFVKDATFQIDRGDGANLVIAVSFFEAYHGQEGLLKVLDKAREGDVVVANQGLHYMILPGAKVPEMAMFRAGKTQRMLLEEYESIRPRIRSAVDRGVNLVWRETSAAHFETDDGYWLPSLMANQTEERAWCVPSTGLNAIRSRERSNGLLIPFMRSLNATILEVWESSFLLPEKCHVGGGKDCVHFTMPGPTSFWTESLIGYIADTF